MRGTVRIAMSLAAVALSLTLSALARPAHAQADFALGLNAEKQTCRAVARFDAPQGAREVDIYCGAWERPSGRAVVFTSTSGGAFNALLGELCAGPQTEVGAKGFASLAQISCAHPEDQPKRYGLLAKRNGMVAVGAAYPSDWAPLVKAASVLAGVESAQAAAHDSAADTPGMRELAAVYPNGAPGRSAEVNYELLRRRAYERNAIWNFGTAEQDFEALLRAHQTASPDDKAGEAEILAEIGLNMSGARRFEEAAATLAKAKDIAASAKAGLLLTKIQNYQAINALNERRFQQALDIVLSANRARAALASGAAAGASAQTISSAAAGADVDAETLDQRRSLLISVGDVSPEEKAAILSAQGAYIAAVAARALGKADAPGYLAQASALLGGVGQPPSWLVAEIYDERAAWALSAHDPRGAEAAANAGLAVMATSGPGTREQAHLLLALEKAQAAEGRLQDAARNGRQAMTILSRQTESPGMPADVAAGHLQTLLDIWTSTKDPQAAAEYFSTLSLVWDGAAARSAAQLAARLALKGGGAAARAYQDAERDYRAAVAQHEKLDTAGAPADEIAQADRVVKVSSRRLVTAEENLRQASPQYLELLSPVTGIGDLTAALHPREGYLRIAIGEGTGYGILVTPTTMRPYRVNLTADAANQLANRIHKSVTLRGRRLPDYDIQDAHTLYAALIAPVQDALGDTKDLQIDVGGALASVSFAALVEKLPEGAAAEKIAQDQDYTDVAFLAKRVSLSNALGPASFVRLRKAAAADAPDPHVAVFGDFTPAPKAVAERLAKSRNLPESCEKEIERTLTLLSALPDTAEEARGVARTFGDRARLKLGAEFTDADFLNSPDVGQAGVIVIATHGVLGLSSCFAEPALLTSLGDTGEGLIEASALMDRKLKARLIVLSACDTAGGGRSDVSRTGMADGGEALSGLARGFLYAGASSVLATEWKVDSTSSAAEVQALLAEATKPGATVGQALSDAQRKLYSVPETAHPFYWAPFVLIGDGAARLTAAAPVTKAAL